MKSKLITDEQISPYDKIGFMMAKKAKVPMTFKKKKSKSNQSAMVQKKFEHKIISLDEFANLLNEGESNLLKNYDNTYWEVIEPFTVS